MQGRSGDGGLGMGWHTKHEKLPGGKVVLFILRMYVPPVEAW